MAELTVRHREMLAFEAQWWRHDIDRATAIRHLFGLSETRYLQILNVVVEWPAAAAHDPLLVRRLRHDRALARSARVGSATERILNG
ncbi:MAG: hypothetical protein JWN61_942 [Pseudonocardiales bacterium]|nr:hypothetical protein [Pseudonocardiales bacterium]